MEDPIADLMAAIERASALEQEGSLEDWRVIDARLRDMKVATRALRAIIAGDVDEEVRQEHQRALRVAKRLHHGFVLLRAYAITRQAQDN